MGKGKGRKKKKERKKQRHLNQMGPSAHWESQKGSARPLSMVLHFGCVLVGVGMGPWRGLRVGPCATLLLFPFYQSEVGSEDLGRMHCPLVPSCLYLTCLNSQAGCQCVITPFILFFTPCDPLSAALSFRNDNGTCSERVALVSSPFYLFKIIIILIPFKKLNGMGWDRGNIQTRLSF